MLWVISIVLLIAGVILYVRSLQAKDLSVEGRHIVITGGSDGLGLAFARLVASKGAHVSIIARNRSKIDDAIRSFPKAREGQKIVGFTADVADAGALSKAISDAVSSSGRVDILVANAGLSIPKLFNDQTLEEANKMMQVNYFGAVNATKIVLPEMLKSRSGRLVYVASTMSLTAFMGYAAYCGSKWALRGFVEALYSECAPRGVDVNIFYAPTMQTAGLTAENLVKPASTTELEAMGDAVTAEVAAASLYRGLGQNRFAVSGDLGAELFAMGSLPSLHDNLPLRTVLAPVLSLASAAWRWNILRVAQKHNKN